MHRYLFLLALLLCPVTNAMEYKVEVDAGGSHRKGALVAQKLDVSKNVHDLEAVAVCDGTTLPAQLTAGSMVYWIVPDLPAGKTETYMIKLGKDVLPASTKVFRWKDSSKGKIKSMDLVYGDRPVLRYMYTPFDRRDIETTKKPFHHVFAPDGSRPITQGLKGDPYPHHRGIYFGYNKCTIDGETYDVWHAHKGEHQEHEKVLLKVEGPVLGGHVLKIHWNDRKGKPFVEETRTVFAYRPSKGQTMVEFTSMLKPVRGPVELNGDRQHAGAQFRAAKEVAANQKQTRYLRPAKWSSLDPAKQYNTPEHKDLPWNAIQFAIEGQGYTVAYLTSPKNPDGARFSERLYGRFGEFIPWKLRSDNPLTVKYRWWVVDTRDVKREDVQMRYEDLANPPKTRVK